jgi:hypothetical protein
MGWFFFWTAAIVGLSLLAFRWHRRRMQRTDPTTADRFHAQLAAANAEVARDVKLDARIKEEFATLYALALSHGVDAAPAGTNCLKVASREWQLYTVTQVRRSATHVVPTIPSRTVDPVCQPSTSYMVTVHPLQDIVDEIIAYIITKIPKESKS